MELASAVETITMISVITILFSASLADFRTRTVSDRHWAAAGAVGLTGQLFTAHLTGNLSFSVLTSLLAGALFLLSVFSESESTSRVLRGMSLLLATASLLNSDGNPTAIGCSVSVFVCFLFLAGFYTGIIRGGADAKCLIVIALVLPVYPEPLMDLFPDVPAVLKTAFPPAVAVLFTGAVMSVVGGAVYCTSRNLKSHSFVRGFYRGYMMPVAAVPDAFAWPAEDIVGGERVRCGIPADDDVEKVCGRFLENGISEMYVTPMMPFIVPLTAALLFVLAFGNPMFIL